MCVRARVWRGGVLGVLVPRALAEEAQRGECSQGRMSGRGREGERRALDPSCRNHAALSCVTVSSLKASSTPRPCRSFGHDTGALAGDNRTIVGAWITDFFSAGNNAAAQPGKGGAQGFPLLC